MKLKNKLILSFVIISIIPTLLLGIFSVYTVNDRLKASAASDIRTLLLNAESTQNEQIQKINASMDFLVLDQKFQLFLSETYTTNDDYITYYSIVTETIDPMFSVLLQTNPNVSELSIYTAKKIPEHAPFVLNDFAVKDSKWYLETKEMVAFVSNVSYDEKYIYVAKKIVDISTQDFLGILCVKLEKSKFFPSFITGTDSGYFEIKDNGHLIFKSGQMSDSYLSDSIQLKEGWQLTYYQPSSYVKNTNFFMVAIMLICVILSILLVLLCAYLLSRAITKRINYLLQKMRIVAGGDLDTDILNDYTDEIGSLILMLNHMVSKLKAFKSLELTALQAQINPHFLYNTLSMIRWEAIDAGAPKISHIVENLSQFYRTALSNGKNIISVSDEINNLTSYLNLQQHMHENKFVVEYQIEESIKDFKIPKFILEPFAENAVEHGILSRESDGGIIKVSGVLENDSIVFTIFDNGPGLPMEKHSETLFKDNDSYGIKNVNERLALSYGNEYTLAFDSEENSFFKVTIVIPISHPNA